MDEQFFEALARAAGLDRALAEFRDDVIAAATESFAARSRFVEPAEPAAEPWPPMRPGIGR